jgi:phosphoribosylglycinamide formyltransferase 1
VTLALGVLVSGNGSNLQAILDAIQTGKLNADCRIVVSNRPSAYALVRAENAGIKTLVLDHKNYDSREDFDRALVASLQGSGVEWVALAGFMRVLTDVFLQAFARKIVNIHPSLLPAFPGVSAQAQALAYGVKVTGCTAHFVDSGVDTGPIIAQSAVPVLESDTLDLLQERILLQEHKIFVDALQAIAEGKVRYPVEGRRTASSEPSSLG